MDSEPNQMDGHDGECGERTGHESSVVLDAAHPIASTPCKLSRPPHVARQLFRAEHPPPTPGVGLPFGALP